MRRAMREILFKNLTSPQSRKKDILLKEIFEKDGVRAKTERRYFYFIKDIARIDASEDVQNWIDKQNTALVPNRNRHFHILKEHSDELGEERLICKVAGTFYVVIGREVYTIAFLHSFKVTLVKAILPN
jgi:hypothetical protein